MYNKLFTKILDSSIWLQPTPTRIVWVTFLAAMDEHGFVPFAGIGNVAQRAVVTLDEARAAITCLESPDPDSSDPSQEGRRIERVPGGWMVLNAEKYRALSTRVEQVERTRDRVRRHRERLAVTDGNGPVTPCNADVTLSEAYTEAETDVPASSSDDTGKRGPSAAVAKDPPIKALFREHERLFVKTYHEKPGPYGKKEGALAKRILATHDLERAKTLLATYFEAEDPFFRQAGHTFSAFAACLTKLVSMTARPVNGRKVARRLYDCPVCGGCHAGTPDRGCTRDEGPVYDCRVCGGVHQGHDESWCPDRQVRYDEAKALPLRRAVAS